MGVGVEMGLERVRERERDRDKESNRQSLPGFLMTIPVLGFSPPTGRSAFLVIGSKRHFCILIIKFPFSA